MMHDGATRGETQALPRYLPNAGMLGVNAKRKLLIIIQ